MIATVIESVISRIQALVGGFKYVGYDCGQLSHDNPSVKFPCCLVNMERIDVSEQLGHTQSVEATISITLAWLRAQASVSQKRSVLDNLNLIDDVHCALCDFKPHHNTGYMCRTAIERSDANDGGTEQWTLTYTVRWEDRLSVEYYKAHGANVQVQ